MMTEIKPQKVLTEKMGIEAVSDFCNDLLNKTSWQIDHVDALLQCLQEKYFYFTAETLQKNNLKQYEFINDYEQVRVIISAIRELTWGMREDVGKIDELDYKKINMDTGIYAFAEKYSKLPQDERKIINAHLNHLSLKEEVSNNGCEETNTNNI